MEKFNIIEFLEHCDTNAPRIFDYIKLPATRDSCSVQLFGFKDSNGVLSVYSKMGHLRGYAPEICGAIPLTELLYATDQSNVCWKSGNCSDDVSKFFCVTKHYDKCIDISETMYYKVTESTANEFFKSIENCFGRKIDKVDFSVKFEDGDFVCIEDSRIYYIAIFNKYEGLDIVYHALLDYSIRENGCLDISEFYVRPATDSEKQQLLETLLKMNKRWNSDTKMIEDVPVLKFKELDYFLAKTAEGRMWMLYQFAFEKNDIIYAVGGWSFSKKDDNVKIIAYNNRTKYLLGTSNEIQEKENNV